MELGGEDEIKKMREGTCLLKLHNYNYYVYIYYYCICVGESKGSTVLK